MTYNKKILEKQSSADVQLSYIKEVNKCAILVFARSAVQEGCHKRLSCDLGTDILVYDRLNKKVIALANKSGFPVHIYDEKKQIGVSFGVRLANAVDEVFHKGFDKVVVLGNDCPELTIKHLVAAIGQLQHANLVLGPDLNGGAYLIGISREIFDKQTFSSLQWQSNRLLADIKRISLFRVLPALSDIKDINSVKAIIHRLSFASSIRTVLLRVLNYCKGAHLSFSIACKNEISIYLFALRGPPLKG